MQEMNFICVDSHKMVAVCLRNYHNQSFFYIQYFVLQNNHLIKRIASQLHR